MEVLQNWGVDLILSLQQLSPGLDGGMRFFSFLGQIEFFLVFVPFLYWCVDATLGIRLLSVLVISDFANGLLKWTFHGPRPYWIDVRVRAMAAATSYGLPSGHAQSAVVVWGFCARFLKRAWAWVAALILILGVSLSRLYLGVHFPHDVLTGWVVGAVLLAVYLWAEPRVVAWLRPKSLGFQIGAAFGLTVVLLGLLLGVRAAIAGVADPPGWGAQAAIAFPPAAGEPAIDPRNLESLFVDLGTVFGVGAGLALMRRFAPFEARGPWWRRIARFGLGVAVLVALRVGLGAVFPREPLVMALVFRYYVRYAIMVLWAIWLAPWVFIKVGLAEAKSQPRPTVTRRAATNPGR